MITSLRIVATAGALAVLPAAAGSAGAGPVPVSVTASPGQADAVARAMGASALRIVRRDGRQMQVTASPDRVAGLRALPGVAAAHVASASAPEQEPEESGGAVASSGQVRSEGFERIGADSIQPLADDGRGVVIAILDLGFGASRIPGLQARRELPPASRLQSRSFDPVWGLAGRNAYGNATNHGELVAQTVYDYAPAARYLFVNYHSEQDFQVAVDWLIQQRPDVVVHSNSFLEGPFDGSGPAAQAVDRAASAGIAWVNSAGNYAERHWEGEWADVDADDVMDWPSAPGWTFTRDPGTPITFALSWEQAEGAEATDLDLVLEKRTASGEWAEVVGSRDRQSDGARAAERFTGVPSGDGGEFRLRVVLAAGPPPDGRLTLFSREVGMSVLGDPVPGSIPTPGDADGSITVGAVDWTNNSLKAYSSNGPTDDGRMKPDITAPTNTRVLTATGARAIGGTSNAAPNAGGAIALLIGARRLAGAPLDIAALGDVLAAQALDLGAPGPDNRFGAGRVRVDVDAPEIRMQKAPRRLVKVLPVRLRATVEDASRLVGWSVAVDGRTVIRRRGESSPRAALGRIRLPDGPHVIELRATDWPGNVGVRTMRVTVDTRPPRVRSVRIERVGVRRLASGRPPRGARPARALLDVSDVSASRLVIVFTNAASGRKIRRTVRIRGNVRRAIPLGPIPGGRYTVGITASDAAGHVRATTRVLRLRP